MATHLIFLVPSIWSIIFSNQTKKLHFVSTSRKFQSLNTYTLYLLYFSDSATSAGFNVLRLISEPVSAVLAYDIGQENNNINR